MSMTRSATASTGIILGNTDSTDIQLNMLDMNQDGDVNVIDIVEMIHYVLDN